MTHFSRSQAEQIEALAADRRSGASELLQNAIPVLRSALEAGDPLEPVARAICRAQPCMATVWNAALEALASKRAPGRFERFAERVARGSEAVVRIALDHVGLGGPSAPLRIVTLSSSRTVARTIEALARLRTLSVACAEGRPAMEGRQLATSLSPFVPVIFFTDAAIGHGIDGADMVLVGADAVGPDGFINKSGTHMLAAAASLRGIPVYVLATRDKFASRALSARLSGREGAPDEVWDSAPHGVTVRNPYFETTPLDLVTAVITDIGVLDTSMVPDACEASWGPELQRALDDIG